MSYLIDRIRARQQRKADLIRRRAAEEHFARQVKRQYKEFMARWKPAPEDKVP